MARLNEWDFFNRHVQSGLVEGQFMAAQYTLVAAGPPNLAFLASSSMTGAEMPTGTGKGAIVFPLGITQRFGIAQTRQHARVWEIGSERSYWVSGRTVGQITLGRVMYHGPNLLRALMAYYKSSTATREDLTFPHLMGSNNLIDLANTHRNPHSIQISPGDKNIFLNLASDLFGQTMGLMLYFKDSNNEAVYATYAENCVIPSHSLSMDAGGTVMQENVQLQFERLVPVKLVKSVHTIDIDSSHRIYTADGPEKGADGWTSNNF